VAGCRDNDGRQGAVQGARGPWRYAGWLDGAVKAFVEMPKSLIVQPVSRLVGVEQGQDETRLVRYGVSAKGYKSGSQRPYRWGETS
jgi:hypothetical protein